MMCACQGWVIVQSSFKIGNRLLSVIVFEYKIIRNFFCNRNLDYDYYRVKKLFIYFKNKSCHIDIFTRRFKLRITLQKS